MVIDLLIFEVLTVTYATPPIGMGGRTTSSRGCSTT